MNETSSFNVQYERTYTICKETHRLLFHYNLKKEMKQKIQSANIHGNPYRKSIFIYLFGPLKTPNKQSTEWFTRISHSH